MQKVPNLHTRGGKGHVQLICARDVINLLITMRARALTLDKSSSERIE